MVRDKASSNKIQDAINPQYTIKPRASSKLDRLQLLIYSSNTAAGTNKYKERQYNLDLKDYKYEEREQEKE